MAMKRFIILLSLLYISVSVFFAQDNTDSTAIATTGDIAAEKSLAAGMTQEVIAAYNDGNFEKVIEILEKEKDEQKIKGLESADLYYNLGNAYFRNRDIAHSLLNYERALLLAPGDRDTKHNINYVTTFVEDKILVADTFFLTTWMRALQHSFGANTWATIAVVSFILLIGCLFLFFFGKSITIKKASFYIGIIMIVIVLLSNIFAFGQKSELENRSTAIIMAGSVSIKSSPDINSKELFILHSGTKVKITKEDRRWLEIEIADGNVGWIQRDALEII